MKVLAILSLVAAAAVAAPNNYGKVEKTVFKFEAPTTPIPRMIIRQPAYEAPAYKAPAPPAPPPPPTTARAALRTPAPLKYESKYVAPAPIMTTLAPIRLQAPTQAPTPFRLSYEAPKVVLKTPPQVYEAPKVVVQAPPQAYQQSYGGYEAPSARAELLRSTEATHQILKHVHDTDHKGNYNLEVQTSHGISHVESGSLMHLPESKEGPVGIKKGQFSYTGTDGKLIKVDWTADHNGFKAVGDHLPTPHPIPEEIRKGLELPRIPEFQPKPEEELEVKPIKESHHEKQLAGHPFSYGYEQPKVVLKQQPMSYGYSAPAPPAPAPPAPVRFAPPPPPPRPVVQVAHPAPLKY